MRHGRQIITTQNAFNKLNTAQRHRLNFLALKQFLKPIEKRATPEELIIRLLGEKQ